MRNSDILSPLVQGVVSAVGIRNENTGKLLQKLFQMVGVSCFLVVVKDYSRFVIQFPTAVDEHVGSRIGRASVLTDLTGSFIGLDYMKPAQFFMQFVVYRLKIALCAPDHPIRHGRHREINSAAAKFLAEAV